MTTTCRWPECERTEILARGLCDRCYRRSIRSESRDAFAPTVKVCQVCYSEFVAGKHGKRYCSEMCRSVGYARKLQARRDSRVEAKAGRVCGKCATPVPLGVRADSSYCSIKCQQSAWYEENESHLRESSRRWARENQDLRNVYEHRRRQRRLGREPGAIDSRAMRSSLANECGICGDWIDPSVEYPDPMSKSLDHIVPLARGGAHCIENVQAAHLRCNLKKGASVQPVEAVV